MTYRRVGALLARLPSDSSLSQAITADAPPVEPTKEQQDALWELEHHLLALIFDTINVANWQRGGGKGGKPKPLQRPGVGKGKGEPVAKNKSTLTTEQKIAALKRIGPERKDN